MCTEAGRWLSVAIQVPGTAPLRFRLPAFLVSTENSSAANGTFIVDGGLYMVRTPLGRRSDGRQRLIYHKQWRSYFFEGSSAGNATLIANPGSNGGEGGRISFENGADDGGEARIELFGNGTLDIELRRVCCLCWLNRRRRYCLPRQEETYHR